MFRKRSKKESRTWEQLVEHYRIEKELADQLRNAVADERKRLYSTVYDEYFLRVPHNPQSVQKLNEYAMKRKGAKQVKLIRRFLKQDCVFVEIGPGDCGLAMEVCRQVKEVYAIDVSKEITSNGPLPENFHLVIFDGIKIPLPDHSAKVVYSNQLMEHLHPEDALAQLSDIYRVLKPGGVYICITPNRLNGPHDISGYFEEVATGFHLKEYTLGELVDVFKDAGFQRIKALVGAVGIYVFFPVFFIRFLEKMLGLLPSPSRRKVSGWLPLKILLGIRLVAVK